MGVIDVYSGFFNSNETHDRKYNAEHFSRFFDGLICDGVYVNFPDGAPTKEKAFYVKPASSGYAVTIAPGRAWFRGTWTYNAASQSATLTAPTNALMHRIDAIVIDVDTSDEGRQNQILIINGTQDTKDHPVYRPTLIDAPNHKQYPIAFVEVIGGTTSISAENITNVVGTSDPDAIPAVEALLEYSNLSKEEMKAYIDAADRYIQSQVDAIKTPTFTEAATESNLVGSGESINTMWGKVKKIFSIILAGLPIKYGGTGGTSVTAARANLNIGSVGSLNTNGSTSNFLRGDGTWVTPPNTTYNNLPADSTDAISKSVVSPAEKASWNAKSGSDVNVNQVGITNPIPSSYNTYFEVLLSGTADNVSRSENSKKSPYLAFNPVTMDLYTNSINNIRFGVYDGKAGYYEDGTFKAFKDPTGTASAGDVLSGKTFANAASDTLVTGTMTNNGAVTKSLNCGASYTIPAGYHDGSGKVTANSLASQTSADATAAQILKDKTAWVNGSKLTGTMANYSGSSRKTVTPSGGTGDEQLSLSAGYHDSVIVNRTNAYNAGVNAQKAVYWDEVVELGVDGSTYIKYPLNGVSHWKCSDTSTPGYYNGNYIAGDPANNNSWHDCTNSAYQDIRFQFMATTASMSISFTFRRVCYKVK